MRVPDPHGSYKKCAADQRLMIAREPGEHGGEYFRVMPEGFLQNYDGLNVKVNADVEGLDLNRNFPSFWRQEFEQVGAGDYPTSEPEVKAMVDFIVGHRNIGAAISYHTHSGVILRPMGTMSDDDMIPEDLWSIKRFSEMGAKLTGYPAISIWHEFKYHPKEIITGTQDWVYEHLGALFWVVEMWAPNKAAGITDYKWVDWYREHPVEDDLKLMKWNDEQCGGQAHVAWKPFMHPQLGQVEIGGWDKMNYWRNPPPALREREVERFPKWMTQIALSLPKLELLRTEVRALGPDTWRVKLRGRQQRLAAGLCHQARAAEKDRARRDVRDAPAARRLVGVAGERQAAHGRSTARRPCAEGIAQRLLAEPRSHGRPRRRRVGRACAAGHAPGTDGACRSGRGRARRGRSRLRSNRRSDRRSEGACSEGTPGFARS